MQLPVRLTVVLAVPIVLLVIVAKAQPRVRNCSYLGCFIDGNDGNRDLKGMAGFEAIGPYTGINKEGGWFFSEDDMTIELCNRICAMGRFQYFSLQAKGFCFCGSTYGLHGAANESDCYQACTGNASQICGAPDRNSVYENLYAPQADSFKSMASSMSVLTTAPGMPVNTTHWSQEAAVPFECFAACHRSPDCLACAFVQSSRMCHLLKFAAVPSEIASEAQWVWMKQ